MANLIITVIAIALVAVASLMGAYYGGSAFLNNQSAAGASTVMNIGQQIAGAWKAYLSDNFNTAPVNGLNGATLSLTANNYLQSIPEIPAAAGGVATTAPYVAQVGIHYYMWADVGHPTGAATYALDPNSSACVRIIKTATGTTISGAQATVAPGSISAAGTTGNGTFGCAESTAAPTGGVTGSGTSASQRRLYDGVRFAVIEYSNIREVAVSHCHLFRKVKRSNLHLLTNRLRIHG